MATVDPRPWLIAADWQSRTLLLAELEARGIEVRTEPGMRWAIRALVQERLAPPLILIDTAGDEAATPEAVARLLAILAQDGIEPMLLLLVRVFEREQWQVAFSERATILARPQQVGAVAGLVRSKLA
jgi:hypothetical protein